MPQSGNVVVVVFYRLVTSQQRNVDYVLTIHKCFFVFFSQPELTSVFVLIFSLVLSLSS